MAIPKQMTENFHYLLDAAKSDTLALMECKDKKTGNPVYTICIVEQEGESYCFTPLGSLFTANPYESLISPLQEEEGA